LQGLDFNNQPHRDHDFFHQHGGARSHEGGMRREGDLILASHFGSGPFALPAAGRREWGASEGGEEPAEVRPLRPVPPLGFGSRENDMCMREAIDALSTDCRKGIEYLEEKMASTPPEEWPLPPQERMDLDAAGLRIARLLHFLALVVFVVVVYYAHKRKMQKVQKIANVLDAIHANPEVKATIENAIGEEMPPPLRRASFGKRLCAVVLIGISSFVLTMVIMGMAHEAAMAEVLEETQGPHGPPPPPPASAEFHDVSVVGKVASVAGMGGLAVLLWAVVKAIFNSVTGGQGSPPTTGPSSGYSTGSSATNSSDSNNGTVVQVYTGIPVSAPPPAANDGINYTVTHTTNPDGSIQAALQRLDQPPLPRSVATAL